MWRVLRILIQTNSESMSEVLEGEKKNKAYLCAQHSAVLRIFTLVPGALAGGCVWCCEAAAEMLSWTSEAEVTPSCTGRTMLPPPPGLCWVVLARLAWERASGESQVATTGQCLVKEHQEEQTREAEKQTALQSLTRDQDACLCLQWQWCLKGKTSSTLHWHWRCGGSWLQR